LSVRFHYLFMKKFTLASLFILAMVCFGSQNYAQGTEAPLYLFTVGSGAVTPLQNGQLLEVGQSYDMTAIPDLGSTFGSWQAINVVVNIEHIPGQSTTTNVTIEPLAEYIQTPTLTFTMQAPTEVVSGFGAIIGNSGWQANFEPVPEPLNIELIVYGLSGFALLRRGPCWKPRR